MPNWCSNNITITGPKDKIKAIYDGATAEGLLHTLYPMPEQLRDTIKGTGDELQTEKYDGFTNWYDWAVNNWNTKWDVSAEGLEYEEDGDTATISGWFDSAWAPPVGAVFHYGHRNEDVKIRLSYYEPGMAFVGVATVEEGVSDDDYFEYGDCDSSNVRDAIGTELDDEWNISESMAEYEAENEES